MDKKITGIVGYITFIGWIIAFLAGDKEGAKFHLNQALLVWIVELVASVLAYIPIIGAFAWIVSCFGFVCWVLGLVHAAKEEEKVLPLIGGIQILK